MANSLEDFGEFTAAIAELTGAVEVWSKLGQEDVVTDLKNLTTKAINKASSFFDSEPVKKPAGRGARKAVPAA